MKLKYIQFKAIVNSIFWMIGNGLGMSHYPTEFVYKGHSLGNSVWLGRKGYGYFFCADKTTRFNEVTKEVEEELTKDPDHIVKVREIFEKKIKEKQKYLEFLQKGDFSRLSDEELFDYYKKVLDTYFEVYHYGEPITFMSKDFAEKLKKYLLKKGGTEEEFYTMISPVEKSFLQVEEEEMLNIAIEAKNKGVTNTIKKKIRNHTEKFGWIPYDYGANLYDEEYFFYELHKTLRSPLEELKKKYGGLKNYTKNTKKKQKDIIEKYGVDKSHQKLFAVVRHSHFLIDAKKEFFTKLHLYSQRAFQEVSRRLKLDIDLVRHAFVEEIENYLVKKKKPEVEKLKEREENYYIVTRADGKLDFKQGPEAKKVIDEFLIEYEKKEKKSEEIKGRVAQPGKVSGKVRIIINARECNKIQHGDILVTVMTSPDYMVAVKRAAAIVTDEGGITCHAAIVSRELKTPCITGTKNATKVLKDGDLVEVDADRGIVRKVK